MKETNKKRKLALKKQADARRRKKQLRHDVAEFLVRVHICCSTNVPIEEWVKTLKQGFKGYHRLNARELIREFEEVYSHLHNMHHDIPFYAAYDPQEYGWANSYGRNRTMSAEESATTRSELMTYSDALMSRLMEVAFGLEE